jgi:hypothetical protein
MAYKTEDLYKKAIDAIKSNNLFFLTDVYSYLGISHDTFYKHFPLESEKMEAIKEAVEKNKARTKISIRSKLHSSTSPTGLLALYKLICTPEERKALSMQHHDHTSEGEKITNVTFEYVKPQDSDK